MQCLVKEALKLKNSTSLLFLNGTPDKFVHYITSGQHFVNEQNFQYGG